LTISQHNHIIGNEVAVISTRKLICLRCGHRWVPRKDEVRVCPRCHNPYWDRPREKPRRNGSKEDSDAATN